MPLLRALLISLLFHLLLGAYGLRLPFFLSAPNPFNSVLQVRLATGSSTLDGTVGAPVHDADSRVVNVQQTLDIPNSARRSPKPLADEKEGRQQSMLPVGNNPSKSGDDAAPSTSNHHDPSAYRSVGLDPPPRLISEVDLAYPESAGLREGRVTLRLLINEKGIVDDVMVLQSFPKTVFDDAAMSAFRPARFSPGQILGMAVKSQLTIEVEFMPVNRGANVTGRGY